MGSHDITVVISCFNYGAFLDEGVASLEAQEDGPPRMIVVDDGSTDAATLEVLDSLQDRVLVIRQANQGAAAARNTPSA